MKFNTSISLLLGFVAIFGAFLLDGGEITYLFLLPAITIVLVGTIAAGTAGTSFQQILNIPKLIKIAFFPPDYDVNKLIKKILQFSIISRKEGMLALEDKLLQADNEFLQKLFQLCIDGADKKTLKEVFEIEINHISDRHYNNISFFSKLGGYSPTMGIIGTVMALINTLAAAGGDPAQLIRHIASAFIATLWGILLANLIWFPISDKLKTLHEEEMSIYQVMFEGVYGVASGDTPTVIQARLVSYFPSSKQAQINQELSEYIRAFNK
jgi:chemotaxis protein MotA